MGEDRQSALRKAAPVALITFAVLVVIVVATSLGGGDGSGSSSSARTQTSASQPAKRRFYTVKDGDNLGTISEKTGVPISELESLNPQLDPQSLIAGQRIKLR